ncbi:DUF3349 domain-containing protein [Actinopolymorpha singaporensis]|uniref:DUF3349 domain-containing protein n=1 Tax=Actinopolymorpha singaporensis TaxID=117157 RepID=A0A1H1TVI5_9ACTN|nr:DUF3349 domain-containing protein [Actinopolymorpha singaporensis]SDS63916.1 Protein of unknown function [Actinopolymorpha singaporensis]
MDEARDNFLMRFVEWVRKGYPTGVPRQDYVALLGLLRRKLTNDEILRVADHLVAQAGGDSNTITRQDIETMIHGSVLQAASDDDVARVSAHLAAGGWPLADPPPPTN